MTLCPRLPSARERHQRLRRLGLARRSRPLVALAGRGLVECRIRRLLAEGHAVPAGFHVPLVWAEAASGGFPTRLCEVVGMTSIVADWVDCGGAIRNTLDHFLGAGDWSALIRTTDGDPVREEARQLWEAGLDYQRTAVYQGLLEAVAADGGSPPRRQGRELERREDVEVYFERFVRLFRAIETHGVLPRHRLGEMGLLFNEDRGLGIAMDSEGRLHRLQGGNHRWAIAQVLGISAVPAELRLVHVEAPAAALADWLPECFLPC